MTTDNEKFKKLDALAAEDVPALCSGAAAEAVSMSPPPNVQDPIIRLKMPGCYTGQASLNPAARQYFERHLGKLETEREVVCDTLGGPSAVDVSFCPFERAYAELTGLAKDPSGEPRLVAFNFGNRNGSATYDIFVAHVLPLRNERYADFRLLPVPTSVVQLVTSEIRDQQPANNEPLGQVPIALSVAGRGTIPFRSKEYTLLPDDRTRLYQTKVVMEEVIKEFSKRSPAAAWREAGRYHKDILDNVPRGIHDLLEDTTYTPKDIMRDLRHIWQHPLDAPILSKIVLPDVWKTIRSDRDLRYLPVDEQEQLQYLRARLPLRELEQQDRYLGWLALPDDWDHEATRASLYSQ